MSYQNQRNAKILLELQALVENLGHGQLDLSFDLYDKRIIASTYYGKKRHTYSKNNEQALKDIAERLIKSISQHKTEELSFNVKVRNGFIEQSLWKSEMRRNHQEEK